MTLFLLSAGFCSMFSLCLYKFQYNNTHNSYLLFYIVIYLQKYCWVPHSLFCFSIPHHSLCLCTLSCLHLLCAHLLPNPCLSPSPAPISVYYCYFSPCQILLSTPYSIPGYLASSLPLLCLSLSPVFSLSVSLRETLSHLHIELLSSPLSLLSNHLFIDFYSTCPLIHPFHLSRLLE